VPFFVVNGTLPLSGARPPDALLEAFQRATANNKAQ
jgi:predicted DsbA family dithiol-disulfide isomerase